MNQRILDEIRNLFYQDETQVGITYRLMEEGFTKPSELVSKGAAANTGVISHHKAIIKAILEGVYPRNSSNVANYARRAIDRFLENSPELSQEAKDVLQERRRRLIEIVSDKTAIQNDTRELISESAKLEETLSSIKNAIYVYTFPTYYRAGVDGDFDIRWMKIGLTTNNVWQRILDQNRQTSMPEDPIVIRVYHKEGIDLQETERKIQETLRRVKHEQSSAKNTKAGKEWFATTEDSIDAIAELLGLNIVKFDV